LIGLGDGTFTVQRSDESGIVLPEDAKGLVAISNSAGASDLFASVNNGSVIALRSRSTNAGVNIVPLRFVGKQSELVGARVIVRFSDLTEQTFELNAGGGYLSQSASDSIAIGFRTSNTPIECYVRLSSGRELTHQFDSQLNPAFIDVSSGK
jgi:hypothetical protein